MDVGQCLSRLNRLVKAKLLTLEEKSKAKAMLLSTAGVDKELLDAFEHVDDDTKLAYVVYKKIYVPKTPLMSATSTQQANGAASRHMPSLSLLPPQPTPLLNPVAPMHNRTILFHCPSMEKIAIESVRCSNNALTLGRIKWQRFEDGWPHLFIHDSHDLQYNDVMMLVSFDSPAVIFEQLSTVYALARAGCRSLRVIVPYFPTGTMERVDVVGDVATASTLARMMSATPLVGGGPTQYVFLDIHALQEQFYFTDQVTVFLKSCVRLLLEALQALPADGEPVCICFPDDGAFKRFHNKFPQFNTVICHKLRLENDKRKVEIRDGAEFVEGAHCVIVDDLVKSGGTLMECAAALVKRGAAKVSCYCTHAVFPNQSYDKFLHKSEPAIRFEKFWISDSIPTVADVLRDQAPFEVLSIAPLISFLRQNFWDRTHPGPDPKRYD